MMNFFCSVLFTNLCKVIKEGIFYTTYFLYSVEKTGSAYTQITKLLANTTENITMPFATRIFITITNSLVCQKFNGIVTLQRKYDKLPIN